jgi:hypothetical protein
MNAGEQTRPPQPTPRAAVRRLIWCGPGLLMLIIAIAATAADQPAATVAATLLTLIEAAPAAIAWMLGAWGIGLAALRLLRAGHDRAIGLALGVALMLWTSHALGTLGAFSATTLGLIIAWLPIALGTALFALDLNRRPPVMPAMNRSTVALLLLPALGAALMLVAACVPPGTLWRSEAGQFDTLSYHLQLPREWLDAGRLAPMEHNAYSWLPSFMEAAYLHLAAMTTRPGRSLISSGLPPAAIHAAQLLHVLLTCACAWIIARAAHAFNEPRPTGSGQPTLTNHTTPAAIPALFASSFLLLTPWVIVVASCAYNEMAVCLLLAGALLAVRCNDEHTWKRGILAGLMIGAACGAKPTAFFMAGAPVAVLMLASTPPRKWPGMLASGAVAGLIMLAPWLVRNAIACGNPVFPYATGLLGQGPWTTLELARWAAGHHSGAPIAQRIALLTTDRGFGHPQWSIVPALLGISVVIAMLRRPTRRAAWPLITGLALQIALWATIGHQQSRFLIPAIITGALIAAAAIGAARPGRLRTVVAILLQATLAIGCIRIWMAENSGSPAAALVGGVDAISGDLLRRAWPDLSTDDRERIVADLPPASFVNTILGPRSPFAATSVAPMRVFLLGDSTPFYFQMDLLWHTTWSISPIGKQLRAGESLDRIVANLRAPIAAGGQSITHILINFDELARLRNDGWYDPDVTPEIAARIVGEHGRVIRAWPGPGGGSVLIELEP